MAQRDRNAAAAGLAALGALMYARSRKEKEEEASTPSAASARAEPDIASMDVPTVPPMGASAAPQQAAAQPTAATPKPRPTVQPKPTAASAPFEAGGGRGRASGATAGQLDELRRSMTGAGGGRGKAAGPTVAQLAEMRDSMSRMYAGRPGYDEAGNPITTGPQYDELGRPLVRGAMKKGGSVKKMASGGMASASKRADGCAARGKTRGKIY